MPVSVPELLCTQSEKATSRNSDTGTVLLATHRRGWRHVILWPPAKALTQVMFFLLLGLKNSSDLAALGTLAVATDKIRGEPFRAQFYFHELLADSAG